MRYLRRRKHKIHKGSQKNFNIGFLLFLNAVSFLIYSSLLFSLLHSLSADWHSNVVGLLPSFDLLETLNTKSNGTDQEDEEDYDPVGGKDSQDNDCSHHVGGSILSMTTSVVK